MDPRVAIVADTHLSVAKSVLQQQAIRTHGITVEMGYVASLVAERLSQAISSESSGEVRINAMELEAVQSMLRDIQNTAHLVFLNHHGSEADYQAIGEMTGKKHRTPSGRWRSIKRR